VDEGRVPSGPGKVSMKIGVRFGFKIPGSARVSRA
jgi:hypothetical protein